LSFDEHSAGYSQKVGRALAVVGLEHDFFFEAKVRQILEASRRLGRHGRRRSWAKPPSGLSPNARFQPHTLLRAGAAERSERECGPSLGQPTLPAEPAQLGASGSVRVLEIGCGIGLLTQRLRPLFNVWGIDPSIASLGQAAVSTACGGRMIAADGLRMPFADESFDMVIAVCVLHHVPVDQRGAFLAEAARITRRGGLVLLCEHNPWNPLTRLVVGRCELDREAFLLAMPEARRRLSAAGLSDIRARYILFFPWRGAFWRWVEARLAWLPLGGQYVIDAMRT
jgi:SAM-dependent methyltransferase